ncbi:MAG TPA: hypothetical protein PKE30_12575 [Niabella sp.]|nr:hypothetical protein [Niabella sp.]
MKSKKKIQKTEYEMWQEQNEDLQKELGRFKQYTEEVSRMVDEGKRMSEELLLKANIIKANNPAGCNKCKYKSRCPWVIKDRVPGFNEVCLKQTLTCGLFKTSGIEREAKKLLESKGPFLN